MARAEPLVYLVAGEPSGDQLGAYLMRSLREATGGRIRFAGLAGERMQAEGMDTLFPIDELALMGLEVLPHVRRLFRRMDEVAEDVRRRRPDIVVMIDAQSFTKRVAARLAGAGIPLVLYVAPQVWAWDRKRCRKIAALYDHLLLILPFEAPYFETYGLSTTFVGHPAAESVERLGDGGAFRARHGIPDDAPLLCVLCGSRRGEVARHLEIYGETLALLAESQPGLHCAVPTVGHVGDTVAKAAESWPFPAHVVFGTEERYGAFAASDVALAVSGTVTVESAFSETPTIVTYRASRFTAAIARYLLTVKYASAVNLVLDRPALPEFIQERCTPANLASEVERLLTDEGARNAIVADIREAKRRLSVPGELPSQRAARAVLDVMASNKHNGISSAS